MKFIPRTKKI